MGSLSPKLAGVKVTLAGCMPGTGVGPHLLRLPSWASHVALPHETIPRTSTWADGGKVGQRHDALGHSLLKGTRTSTAVCPCLPWGPTCPLLSRPSAPGPARTTSWVSPSGHGPRSFFAQFHPNASLSLLLSDSLHSPQDKDRAPYPGIQGLSSCPAATWIVNAMCVLAWALG